MINGELEINSKHILDEVYLEYYKTNIMKNK